MTIQQTIEAAIRGGWDSEGAVCYEENDICNGIFVDPSFWQCLGKELGWEDHQCEKCSRTLAEYSNGCVCCGNKMQPAQGLHHWHRLIDHLADGKDINSFFENL